MISKEEIEKAKKILYPLSVGDFITWFNTDGVVEVEIAVENLLEAYKQLENKQQKVIEKLKKDKKKNNELEFIPLQVEKAYNNYYKLGKIDEIDEILEIMRGE